LGHRPKKRRVAPQEDKGLKMASPQEDERLKVASF